MKGFFFFFLLGFIFWLRELREAHVQDLVFGTRVGPTGKFLRGVSSF